MAKNPPTNVGDARDVGHGLDPWAGKISWRGTQQPVFFPGESHGQSSLQTTARRVAKS